MMKNFPLALMFCLLVWAGCPLAWGADLIPAAERAMHGFMINNPQRLPGPEGFYRYRFGSMGLPIPWLTHAQWDLGDCTARAVQQWLEVREMTGDQNFGKEVESGQRALLLSLLDPRLGVITVPELADRKTGEPYVQMWDQGRTMRALVSWWLSETDPARKQKLTRDIDRMIQGVQKFATEGNDPIYGRYAVWHADAFVGQRRLDDLCIMRGGQLLEPLAIYWQHSKNPAALDLAQRVTAGVLSGHEADGYTGWLAGTLRFGANGSFTGHFHDHASIAMGVARFGKALYRTGEKEEGLKLIRWAKQVYDWTISPENPNCGASFGWFPENNGDSSQARQIDEICSLADMIQFAGVLASAAPLDPSLKGYDALWDHVERYGTNTLLQRQFRITPAYAKMVNDYADSHTIHNHFLLADFDAQGTFDHLQMGHQTMIDEQGGHLSQMLYGVDYDNTRAFFGPGNGQLPPAKNFKVTQPVKLHDKTFTGQVQTSDGKLSVDLKTTLGHGPYLVRDFMVRNVSKAPVKDVRFVTMANLDFTNFNAESGTSDPASGRVLITSAASGQILAMGGAPKPDFVHADDASMLLSQYQMMKWNQAPSHTQGNAGGVLGWQIGTLAPGEAKTIRVILAAVDSQADLDRAFSGKDFDHWDDSGANGSASAALAAAKCQEGGWTACAYPNDAVYLNDAGQPMMHMMGCCHYSGVRGLYATWKPAFEEHADLLSVRLPINRKGKLADQTITEDSHQVTRRIQLHDDCQVRVRIPDWADLSKVSITATGSQKELHPQADGRWLDLGKLARGTDLQISYPLVERTTHQRVGGNDKGDVYADPKEKIDYTIQWRGNQVISIDPPGQRLPLFAQ
jgi:hypothetical protein